MRIASQSLLDALCAEYILGTLRGGARRRFEAALLKEPLVALRLRHWEATATPRFSKMIEVEPPAHLWRKLERELELSRYRLPWYQRTGFWKGWASAATAAMLILLAATLWSPRSAPPTTVQIAQLTAAGGATQVSAQRTSDGGTLVLKANRPVLAGPNQSYELWLIPGPGAAPISLAVLGNLDASIALSSNLAAQLRAGATLAISTEPAGGSPTGQPTGAVILAGQITA